MADPSCVVVVFIESPYSGDIDRNLRYLMLCKLDSWARGEYPCSSHDNLTTHPIKKDFYVSDYDPAWDIYTRDEAISRSHALRHLCSKTVFYSDFGVWDNSFAAMEYCKKHDIPSECRFLDIDKVLSHGSLLITREFIKAVLNPYEPVSYLTYLK